MKALLSSSGGRVCGGYIIFESSDKSLIYIKRFRMNFRQSYYC